MAESVPVSCPECLRTQAYAPPAFPCVCGNPVAPAVVADSVAEPIRRRNWADSWVTVRCGACDRDTDWPHPELGCPCGTVLRVPVRAEGTEPGPASGGGGDSVPAREAEAPSPLPPSPLPPLPPSPLPPTPPSPSPVPRPVESGSPWFGPSPRARGGAGAAGRGAEEPGAAGPRTFAERYPARVPPPPEAPRPEPLRGAFRPVTIRTARDAVAAAAGYLRWLGFRDVVQPEELPSSGVDLRAPGLVAQVDPSTRPTGLRAVECLWLNGLNASGASVFFSLAGYTPEARSRAAEVGLPLFVLDLTGTPQPVNGAADDLAAGGA
ncbi:hypothetical protein [Streptomyces sp. NPDC017868]|uniref:hypothetical protein n=1 Tax=Streptomyces sp. NPDC017868 TaxID=3365014 RepID=UPI0037BD7490